MKLDGKERDEKGVFDFICEVGAKLGIGAADAAPLPPDLEGELKKHGVAVDGLDGGRQCRRRPLAHVPGRAPGDVYP